LRKQEYIGESADWLTIVLYLLLITMGWLNIYAAVYDDQAGVSIFNLSLNSGKQLLWMGTALVMAVFIMVIDFRFFNNVSYIIYGTVIVLLIAVLIFGKEVSGARSWFEIGAFRFQPSEFAKFATAMGLAKFLDNPKIRLDSWFNILVVSVMISAPIMLIILQPDPGTALIFLSFMIVLYREGLPGFFPAMFIFLVAVFVLTLLVDNLYIYGSLGVLMIVILVLMRKSWQKIALTLGIFGLIFISVFSVDYVVNSVLKPHQQNRIKVLFNPNIDPLGVGWNVTQSKIAIGSGGFNGKGFLQGTQTKFDFVPEQSTDFIFCTIGEEHGWIGSIMLIGLFLLLIMRIIAIAERQKSRFARVYGYAAAAIIFMHFMVNIGMTIGLFPVVGIPLPFFSYGGSSLWSFTILLFVLIKLDAHRKQIFAR
jgi:rod shape determining protein RodA